MGCRSNPDEPLEIAGLDCSIAQRFPVEALKFHFAREHHDESRDLPAWHITFPCSLFSRHAEVPQSRVIIASERIKDIGDKGSSFVLKLAVP